MSGFTVMMEDIPVWLTYIDYNESKGPTCEDIVVE
jgi:hypothetical protein